MSLELFLQRLDVEEGYMPSFITAHSGIPLGATAFNYEKRATHMAKFNKASVEYAEQCIKDKAVELMDIGVYSLLWLDKAFAEWADDAALQMFHMMSQEQREECCKLSGLKYGGWGTDGIKPNWLTTMMKKVYRNLREWETNQ
ncbi:hypothetical protein [Vibrio sp. SCSIO 43137]|uniref:hypothetical protein n=1 Tax=Vibrio sp. SCSIO 43137 TaxID=3021011 RepID=UPI002307D774|nr:hypothetical protein [Vibrio sp. SCSIO 43137]WCE28408.1 hypothetical protein PK654_08445 [Vibrio sp. SCSIO 43137]